VFRFCFVFFTFGFEFLLSVLSCHFHLAAVFGNQKFAACDIETADKAAGPYKSW